MADCAFCPPDGRRFRTARRCSECGKPLCLFCRVELPGRPFRCPECDGLPRDDALRAPEAAIQRLGEAGMTPPFWLETAAAAGCPDDQVVPE
jgi:hypothetical protein